jgi:hypothetical protein
VSWYCCVVVVLAERSNNKYRVCFLLVCNETKEPGELVSRTLYVTFCTRPVYPLPLYLGADKQDAAHRQRCPKRTVSRWDDLVYCYPVISFRLYDAFDDRIATWTAWLDGAMKLELRRRMRDPNPSLFVVSCFICRQTLAPLSLQTLYTIQ